jgi:hypothetical protein
MVADDMVTFWKQKKDMHCNLSSALSCSTNLDYFNAQ